MKILTIADIESPYLWDYYEEEKLQDIDLILAAGDLSPTYLSFLVTMSSAPVLYVHGNHDDHYEQFPPEGCICIDDSIFVYQGIRILGLGGSMRYHNGEHQYTERQMRQRIRRLRFQLFRRKGFDILLTHAPAYQINDDEDLPHRGFACFERLLRRYRPRYFIHGHVHQSYTRYFKRYDRYGDTCIINAYERCVFDYESLAEQILHKIP